MPEHRADVEEGPEKSRIVRHFAVSTLDPNGLIVDADLPRRGVG